MVEIERIVRTFSEFVETLKSIHRFVVWAAQLGIFVLSGVSAFLLRFDFVLPHAYLVHLAYALSIWVLVKSTVFRACDLDRGWWRYVSLTDLVRLVVGNLAGSVLGCVVILIVAPAGFPRSIYVLDLILCFLGTAGLRVVVRMTAEAASTGRDGSAGRSTLIYGAGEAGVVLLREIQKNAKLSYRVRGFLDDQPEKWGARILGVPVLGGGDDVRSLVKKYEIETILIAIPSATGAEMTRILGLCHSAGTECKTVPGLAEVIEQGGFAGQIREVSVEDLLGRNPARLDENQIRRALQDRMVLVTGAAGSIGSELCRQIARFRPAGIVGFDIAESPLFEIDQEMRQAFPQVPFYPEIGSVQNRARIEEVLRRHKPSAIYHAAAYKHVPLMEAHLFEAIENNIFGTSNLALAAAKYGVEDFVLISSDKAVRPTNVMGATKRIAELLLIALQNGQTKFVAVRFGNVLGSNGSVIPIFKKQIAAGGPVTVTHPEMRRFFMTIPEACQLVLQASVIGEGGQICVLDMGQPIKIVELARNLILLSGLKPDEDIKIEFTGMRPGEKLYEELNTLLENTIPSAHEKIRIFVGDGIRAGQIQEWLNELREICATRDAGRLVVALKEMVLDYNPSTYILKQLIQHPKIPPVSVPIDWPAARSHHDQPNTSAASVRLSALGR
jgi:FlaA1/EpsC-like NDP-sugar epimerase